MTEEYHTKVFKSGNSMALRLPKALGVSEGAEMRILRDQQSGFRVEPLTAPKRKFNIDKVWGVAAGLDLPLIAPEDRVFQTRALVWDGSDTDAVDGTDA